MVDAVSGSSTTTTASSANNSLNKLGTDFNSFLTLLTTQLKNQSPTDPVDANAFTQQLVQFASVQQQVNTNTYLEKMLTVLQGNQVSSAASYVGTVIQAEGSQGGLVNGDAQFGYTLPANTGSAEVAITNSAGIVVFVGTGSTVTGNNPVTWDGKNSFTGQQMADGVYNISVKAKDVNGKDITATPYITGTVSSASISNGEVQLNVNGLVVPLSKITSVGNVGATES